MATAPRGRAANGLGSYYEDKARPGRWVGSYTLKVGNKTTRPKVYGKSQAEVVRKVRVALSQAPKAKATASKMTTGEWLDRWVTDVLPQAGIADVTRKNYGETVRAWIKPYVGDVALVELGPEDVLRMMAALEARDLSPNSRRLARTTLRRSLHKAEEWGYVPRNVAALTDAPKGIAPKTDDTLSAEDAEKVLEAAKGDRIGALAVLVLLVGVRQGEALRLRWEHLDIDGEHATAAIPGTKSRASVRKVPLPAVVVEALRDHRTAQRVERMASRYWDDPGLVFPTTAGTPYDRWGILRWWHLLLDAAGVGHCRFHATRHTAATLMLNAGVALEVISHTLGHSSFAITSDIYARPKAELLRSGADAMDRLFAKPGSTR